MSDAMRPITSAGPPAANGTITVTVRVGKSCACAPFTAASRNAAAIHSLVMIASLWPAFYDGKSATSDGAWGGGTGSS